MKFFKGLLLIGSIVLSGYATADSVTIGIGVNKHKGGIVLRHGPHHRRDCRFYGTCNRWDRGDRFDHFPNICYARNGRGVTFSAQGWQPLFNLRARALEKCRWNSGNPRSCYIVACRR